MKTYIPNKYLFYLKDRSCLRMLFFSMKLEFTLRAKFVAEAEVAHRPASQVVRELVRKFVQRQREACEYDEFLCRKAEAGRTSMRAGVGCSNEES